MKRVLLLPALAALIGWQAGETNAGGSHSGGHGHGGHHDAVNIGTPGDAADVDRTFNIAMSEMRFEPNNLSIKSGETVRFVVTNTGEFVHEFNIGTAAMHQAHMSEMLEMMETGALEADRINHDVMRTTGMAHDDGNSLLLEPGETAELIWTFSGDADLELSCNVPGHREGGMRGTLKMGHHDHS